MAVAQGLNTVKLLACFRDCFRQHSEHWVRRFDYEEAGPQLLPQAFLQRVANGEASSSGEYSLGRGRRDLLIAWPRDAGEQRFVIECKILQDSLGSMIRSGLAQTAECLDLSQGTDVPAAVRPWSGFSALPLIRDEFGYGFRSRYCSSLPFASAK